MQAATKKVAQAIASKFADFDERSPVEQMAVYFATGRKLQEVVMDQATYGETAIKDIVECVPRLRNEEYAYGILKISAEAQTVRRFILEQTATPMGNGQHLTLTHWLWVLRHQPWGDPRGREEWLRGELAWLRKESPSATVLEHVEEVLEERHGRELDEVREKVQHAIGLLESW